MRDAFAGHKERPIELPVSPLDLLVVARVIAILALACVAVTFNDGPESTRVAFFLVAAAVVQPGLPIFWRFQDSYRQAQMVTDIIVFVLIVAVAPQYYWLCAVVAAGLVGNHAVLASVRSYVLTAGLTVIALAVVGAAGHVAQYERGVAILAILAAGLGYLGHNTRASMRASREDILHVLSAAGGLAHLTDLSAGVIDVVGDTEAVVGWSREDWLSLDHREIVHPDDFADFWPDVNIRAGALVDRTARIRARDGRWIWIRDVSRVVLHENRPHLRGFIIDVSKQQDGLHRVTTEALTDVLTGLRNRRALLMELGARKLKSQHYLVLIDLNRFKDVNDTLGHEAGDALLQVVADRLTRCLRPDDVLARLGGDEFAIVMDTMMDMSAVVAAVDRVAFEVSRPVEIAGVNITTSISAGIVDARPGEADESIMLHRADIAMYAAKRLNRISAVFDADLERTSVRREQLSRDLSSALASGDLTLHYQPIVDTISGTIVGGEGLARWDHPVFGLLTPAAFLDVVLISDRSGDFTRCMVLDAIATVRTLADAGSAVTIAVNLPIRTLEDVEFGRWFTAACEASAVSPSQLVFEITEQDIHDTESITSAIDRLAELGVTISVDDFGAGHATFERLRWRNVAQLKLDRDLLVNVATDERGREVLRSILDLAARLGYDVVAEGVETDEQFALLRELGCPHAQGYLFARAMIRSKFIDCALRGRVPSAIDPVRAR
ncbi:MAG: diguanylate cyclase (GGDEF)-like protein [Candidatus Azotimanducaceae bacterium]|jgi:diguanylate cyclase (GGDEF)-like protein